MIKVVGLFMFYLRTLIFIYYTRITANELRTDGARSCKIEVEKIPSSN